MEMMFDWVLVSKYVKSYLFDYFAIWAHLFPFSLWSFIKRVSSYKVYAKLFMGFKALKYRYNNFKLFDDL